MKALVLDAQKQLSLTEVPKPKPQPGEVRVRIHAAALNHRDLWIQKGLYPGMKLPCILGADGAGIIDSVGKGVDEGSIGEAVVIYPAMAWGGNPLVPGKQFRVLGMPDPGTFAEYICVPAENIFSSPYATDALHAAAALPLTFLTAYRALRVGAPENWSGKKALITGIGGGVATAGLAQLTAGGTEIYVTSSSPEKIAEAIERGARGGVNYRDEDWTTQLKALSGGIDFVLDGSPAADFSSYLKFLNPGAKVVCYGATGSLTTTIQLPKFFLRYISLIGSTMGSPTDFAEMLDWIEEMDGSVAHHISEVFSFADYQKAFDLMARGEQMGKIVLTW